MALCKRECQFIIRDGNEPSRFPPRNRSRGVKKRSRTSPTWFSKVNFKLIRFHDDPRHTALDDLAIIQRGLVFILELSEDYDMSWLQQLNEAKAEAVDVRLIPYVTRWNG